MFNKVHYDTETVSLLGGERRVMMCKSNDKSTTLSLRNSERSVTAKDLFWPKRTRQSKTFQGEDTRTSQYPRQDCGENNRKGFVNQIVFVFVLVLKETLLTEDV